MSNFQVPKFTINLIKQSIDIVEYIGKHVKLHKVGERYSGICPFHNDTQPSFSVSSINQTFHCYGCNVGGDVFEFIQQFNNCSFIESLQITSELTSIKLPDQEYFNPEWDYYTLNEQVAKLYHSLITSEKSKTYLRQRKFTPDAVKTFQIGYAPSTNESFLITKFQKEKLLELNLIIENEEKIVDKYRARIIFPIKDEFGNITGFIARDIHSNEKRVKYLNTSDTIIFKKHRSLYGLYENKKFVKKRNEVIIVEGSIDLIALFQVGIRNVVGTLGTALSEYNIKILQRFTKNICLMFDGDSAGTKTTQKYLLDLLKYNFNITIIELPERYDPDSFCKKFGKEKTEELINNKINCIEWLKKQYDKRAGVFEKTSFLHELIGVTNKITDCIYRVTLRKEIEKVFEITEDEIRRVVIRPEIERSNGQKDIQMLQSEVNIIQIILSGNVNKEYIKQHLKSSAFVNSKARRIAETLLNASNAIELDNIERDIQAEINKFIPFENPNFNECYINKAILKLKIDRIGFLINQVKKYDIETDKKIGKISELEAIRFKLLNDYKETVNNIGTIG